MSNDEIRKWTDHMLLYGEPDVILFSEPDYADAFVGLTDDDRAVYDFDLMMKSLEDDGMTEEEAMEFIDYNVFGFRQERGPIVIYRMPR